MATRFDTEKPGFIALLGSDTVLESSFFFSISECTYFSRRKYQEQRFLSHFTAIIVFKLFNSLMCLTSILPLTTRWFLCVLYYQTVQASFSVALLVLFIALTFLRSLSAEQHITFEWRLPIQAHLSNQW